MQAAQFSRVTCTVKVVARVLKRYNRAHAALRPAALPQSHVSLPYTPARRAELIHLLAAMRADEYADDVARSYQQEGRCRSCAFFAVCDDRLDARHLVPDRRG